MRSGGKISAAGLGGVMSEEAGYRVMMTAHKMGTSVVVVCAKDVAETKAKEATDLGKEAGFPLLFTAEPEE